MNRKRLFAGVAVEATQVLKDGVAELRQQLKGERIRWTRLENLHLTVEFFGETEEGRIPELEKALAKAASGANVFTMKLSGWGIFGGVRHPRVLWRGVESEGLSHLHGQVEGALREKGWEPEGRLFSPHLTLGRMDRLEDLPRFNDVMSRARAEEAAEQIVRELILYESAAGRYMPIDRWPLGKS